MFGHVTIDVTSTVSPQMIGPLNFRVLLKAPSQITEETNKSTRAERTIARGAPNILVLDIVVESFLGLKGKVPTDHYNTPCVELHNHYNHNYNATTVPFHVALPW